jgi:hypothetical protein
MCPCSLERPPIQRISNWNSTFWNSTLTCNALRSEEFTSPIAPVCSANRKLGASLGGASVFDSMAANPSRNATTAVSAEIIH